MLLFFKQFEFATKFYVRGWCVNVNPSFCTLSLFYCNPSLFVNIIVAPTRSLAILGYHCHLFVLQPLVWLPLCELILRDVRQAHLLAYVFEMEPCVFLVPHAFFD
jgi:hypothetical protein